MFYIGCEIIIIIIFYFYLVILLFWGGRGGGVLESCEYPRKDILMYFFTILLGKIF